jgi:hypothetical protein
MLRMPCQASKHAETLADRCDDEKGDTGAVGFNPFQQRRRSPADYVMVAAAVAICAALVIWAALG